MNDMMTKEEASTTRRASRSRVGLPPRGPARPPVPDLTEVHGPLYPVDRKHEFPRDPPAKVESKSKDEIQFPVYVADGQHQYAEVPKAAETAQTLKGPVLDVSHSHGFTKEETQGFDYKTLQGPKLTVGVESSHKFNMMDSSQKPVGVEL